MSKYNVSKLIASTNKASTLNNYSRTVILDFINDYDIDTLLTQSGSNELRLDSNLSLHFENLMGNDSLPVIDIYLNLENENVPNDDNYAGSMALYGLSESSAESHEHDASGQNRVFDVAKVFKTVCEQSNWSKKQFSVTLIPNRSFSNKTDLTIGRVALYFHKS